MKLRDIKFTDIETSLCAGSYWVGLTGAALLFSSTVVAIGCWGFNKEVPVIVRQGLLLGLGTSSGGLLFLNGVIMEGGRQIELEIDRELARALEADERQETSKPGSVCVKCYYHSNLSALPCAVQPKIVYTNEANDCPDFQTGLKRK